MALTELESIRGTLLFRGLADSELEILGSFLKRKAFPEGAMVFVENMPGECLYLIRKGTVQISRMMAEGDERTLAILGPEDFFGEMAVFEEGPRMVNARVAEEAELLSLNRSDLDALLERHPALAARLIRNILRSLSRRLRENAAEYRQMLRWSLGEGV